MITNESKLINLCSRPTKKYLRDKFCGKFFSTEILRKLSERFSFAKSITNLLKDLFLKYSLEA